MNQLGIEPMVLVAQIINFIIIIFVLSKLLYKPILELLEKRKKEIVAGIELTEKLRIEEEKLESKRLKTLSVARGEAQAIISEAKKRAKDESDRILSQAAGEASSILEKGKTEITVLRKTMEKELRSYSVTLAVAMAKRLLESALPSSDKEKILDKHLKDLESVHISS